MSARTPVKIFILSDGCHPTEDLYFREYVAKHLKKRGIISERYINCQKSQPKQIKSQLANDSILLIFRTLPSAWIHALPDLSAQVKKTIYVLDDDLKAAQETVELPKKYRDRISLFSSNYLDQLLNFSDELIVSSGYLANIYSNYNPSILRPSLTISTEKQPNFQQKKLSVCYHATRSHEKDLEFLQGCLANILDQHSTTFESLIGGSTPKVLSKRKDVTARNPKSWWAFKLFQRLSKRHIGLAPLLDTPYNRGKSHIKFLDIAAVGAVGIYSNREPYSSIVEHGVDGLLASDDPDEWQAHLDYLLSNPDKAEKMAKNAQIKARDIGHPKHAYKFWRKLLS